MDEEQILKELRLIREDIANLKRRIDRSLPISDYTIGQQYKETIESNKKRQ